MFGELALLPLPKAGAAGNHHFQRYRSYQALGVQNPPLNILILNVFSSWNIINFIVHILFFNKIILLYYF